MSYILLQEKIGGPPASQNTFLIKAGKHGLYESAIENMKSPNQIALLRRTKNHLHCCFVLLRRDSVKMSTKKLKKNNHR